MATQSAQQPDLLSSYNNGMTKKALRFEYDPRKAASNLRKHGVSFDEAFSVFSDPLASTLKDDQNSYDEERSITLGLSNRQRILFVVYTEINSVIRLIGARLADPTERRQYEEVL